MSDPFILWLSEIKPEHKNLVGGKGFNLAVLYQNLAAQGILVPNAFVITSEAWRLLAVENPRLKKEIEMALGEIDFQEIGRKSLYDKSAAIWDAVIHAAMPSVVSDKIQEAYGFLEVEYGAEVDVAVRSSAHYEDLTYDSFAGEHDSFLHVHGIQDILRYTQQCIASLFTARAIFYRYEKDFPQFPQEGIGVVVQKMVRSDSAASGVAFSHDPVSLAPYLMRIEGGWGLGEPIVRGLITPDVFLVVKSRGGGNVHTHMAVFS